MITITVPLPSEMAPPTCSCGWTAKNGAYMTPQLAAHARKHGGNVRIVSTLGDVWHDGSPESLAAFCEDAEDNGVVRLFP